jgi:hypothetical protein
MTTLRSSALVLALLHLVTFSALGQNPPEIEAVFTNSKPTLDAVIAPGEWDLAQPSVIEHVLRSGETSKPVPNYQFRLLWDEDALYMLFETNLTNWPGGTGGFNANNNINFYLDPNNDDEENGAGGNMFDGYHPVLYPDTGKTSRFSRPFDSGFRALFHEASINANFGGSPWPASSSEEQGVAIDYVSEVGANGGILEICFPWQLFDSEAGTDLEIFHPDPPEVDEKWFLNVCIISALGDLPTWSWTSSQVFAARPHGVVTFIANPIRAPINVSHDPDSDTLRISWESKGGQLYNLRSEADPSMGEPIDWPIFEGNQDLVATPPINTVAFPLPITLNRFFVVEEFLAPPVTIFLESFDGGPTLPTGWTSGTNTPPDTGTTQWELGNPAGGALTGPTAAKSRPNCIGTNISADYGLSTDIWLRSPGTIDLTAATGATLHFQQFRDIEAAFDRGSVRVLLASDETQQLGVDLINPTDGTIFDWKEISVELPPEALGEIIRLEFRFESDEVESFAGWYIDDVVVTVPAP